jgi:hypothetical protein
MIQPFIEARSGEEYNESAPPATATSKGKIQEFHEKGEVFRGVKHLV